MVCLKIKHNFDQTIVFLTPGLPHLHQDILVLRLKSNFYVVSICKICSFKKALVFCFVYHSLVFFFIIPRGFGGGGQICPPKVFPP